MDHVDEMLSVAVWVEEIGPAKQPTVYNGFVFRKSADVRISSPDGTFDLQYSTVAIGGEILEKFERLERHGFTVVQIPAFWVNEYSRPQQWFERLVNQALEQAMGQVDERVEQVKLSAYNPEVADAVLAILNKSYPHVVSMIDVKREMLVEPSDGVLLTALDALLLERKIEGKFNAVANAS